jgi:hypothetical protein
MAQLMVNAVMAGEGNSTSWIKQKNDCYSPFAEFCASTRETEGEDGDFNPTHPPMMPAHELPSLDTSPTRRFPPAHASRTPLLSATHRLPAWTLNCHCVADLADWAALGEEDLCTRRLWRRSQEIP